MTIPSERSRSIQNVRQLLYDLIDPRKTPRVPNEIRERARQVVKHFPADMYIDQVAEKFPEIFGKLDSDD